MQTPRASYDVVYNGKNITGNILPYVMSINYSDNSEGKSDTIELDLDDSAGLWQFAWYPTKGDQISVTISYLGNTLKCGVFTIDEITLNVSQGGDIVSIKGIAAGITKAMRTRKFVAHEKKTLKEIASAVAKEQGLTLQGAIPDIRIDRKSQFNQTDLQFLRKLSNDYGYTFSVRGNLLTFTSIYELEDRVAALTFNKNELISATITDKTADTYKAVDIKYHNPQKKTTVFYSANEADPTRAGVKSDTLVIRRRVENDQQAEAMAKASLYRFNSLQQEGSIDVDGNPFLVAGNTIQLNGLGVFSGKYYVKESSHTVSVDGGYSSSASIKRVGLIDKSNYK